MPALILWLVLFSANAFADIQFTELLSNFTAGSTFSPQESVGLQAIGKNAADAFVGREIPTFYFSPEREAELKALKSEILKQVDVKVLPQPFWESVLTLSLVLAKGAQPGAKVTEYLQARAGRKFHPAINWEPNFVVSLDIALSSLAHWFDRFVERHSTGTPQSLNNPQIARIQKLISKLEEWTLAIQPHLLTEYQHARDNHERRHPSAVPNSTLLSPTAFGASWGDVFVAGGLQSRPRYSDAIDGTGSVGLGLGDARKLLGLEVSYTMYVLKQLFPWQSPGGLNVKLHRILPNGFAAAVGVASLLQWKTGRSGRSFFGVVSKVFVRSWNNSDFGSQLFLHLGVGDGVYQTTSALLAGENKLSVFASASLRLVRGASLTVNWYGSDLGVGISLAPWNAHRFTVTPMAQDLLGVSGNGPRLALALAWSENLLE